MSITRANLPQGWYIHKDQTTWMLYSPEPDSVPVAEFCNFDVESDVIQFTKDMGGIVEKNNESL